MALFKCSLCICSLLVANVAGIDTKFLAKEAVPNGAQPFSIGVSVNPLAKVISMIQNIQDEVKKEAVDEFNIFDNFACFCKDKTKRLEKMVNHHAKRIDTTSANIALWTTETHDLNADHKRRLANHEEFSTQFDQNTQRLKEETRDWNNIESTFKSDMDNIKQALSSMKDSKATANSFLQVPGAIAKLKNLMEIADAMGLILTPKHKALAASLLQGKAHATPEEMEQYSYHEGSDDIIDLVQTMTTEMKDLHKTRSEDHVKADSSYRSMLQSLRHKLSANRHAIAEIERSVTKHKKETAEARTVLIENNEDLKDTEDVLKQITGACEARAVEYDTRYAARGKELIALNTALSCLTNAHTSAVNMAKQALLQVAPSSKMKSLPEPSHTEIAKVKAKALAKAVADVKDKKKDGTKPLSFLQSDRTELSSEERKRKALDVILSEGKRVQSLMLVSLVAKTGDDPFAKVKELILDLRWRLESEAQGEVNKHVWCTQQLEETRHERNSRLTEIKDLANEMERLDAHMEELKQSIKYHSDKAREIGLSLTKIFTDISQLSAQQLKAMNVQTEARDEIQNAVRILRSYYSQSAKQGSSALLQDPDPDQDKTLKNYRHERMNIHNENEQRADDDGKRNVERAKRQKQRIGDLDGGDPSAVRSGSLGDAIALMETIVSDFNREIGNLRGDLDEEHQELVKSNAILSSQKMKAEEMRDLDLIDLKTAEVDKSVATEGLKTAMNLLDLALQDLENLSPTCVDTGMSYSERVKKREAEMAALEKALCLLGETDEKYGCAP